MKKIFLPILALISFIGVSSCSDMLQTDNDSMVSDPSLSSKTDSVFYALGIAQAMQQLADQYYYVGEMRGDLVTVDKVKTDKDLQDLANYSASSSNAYDSSYVYYKVINNCNYYLAHRDSTLKIGATNVAINEYIAVAAYRAWAYLQLARTYCGDVATIPFYTEPLTSISQIEEKAKDESCQRNLSQIVDELAPSLEDLIQRYPNATLPTLGTSNYSIGTTNWGNAKSINPVKIFVPIEVVLGDMYLETGQYEKAAVKYSNYLCKNAVLPSAVSTYRHIVAMGNKLGRNSNTEPEDFSSGFNTTGTASYTAIFSNTASPTDVITYIPMAVSSQRGKTTSIPLSYGYNYYSIDRSSSCPRVENIQIKPSTAYYTLTDSSTYYYYPKSYDGNTENTSYPTEVKSYKAGDGRACYAQTNGNSVILNRSTSDTSLVYISKMMNANIYVYRGTTIYLHLAEALNGMGYPELAFAILKNGISTYLESLVKTPSMDSNGNIITDGAGNPVFPEYEYLTQKDVDLLSTTLPFLNAENREIFQAEKVYGVHSRGAGTSNKLNLENQQTAKGSRGTAVGSQMNLMYLPKPIIGEKLNEIANTYNVAVGSTKTDSIAAMQDILCDEYAKESAFEGQRFYDLQRLARHFNQMGAFGGNFGSLWFARKLKGNNPTKDLTNPQNWYMPFQ